MKTILLFLNWVSLASLLCSQTYSQNNLQQQIDGFFSEWNNPKTPGAAIAVVKDGKTIFVKGYGSANLEYDIPVTPSTVFHIASISKQFTAFAILLLEQDGKLSLDDDIRKYLPEVPDFGKKITLRQLATHTSGLRDQWNMLLMAGWRLDDVITTDQIMKLVSLQKELNHNPGDDFMYTNTGYTLLAEVVEKVSGKSFSDFTRERIFTPLNMTHTLFYDNHDQIVRNRAYSYDIEGNQYKKVSLNYDNVGPTSLLTTIEDMAKWVLNFEEPVKWNASLMSKMNTRGILNNSDTITYAMGQDIQQYHGLRFINHGGSDAGYRSFLARFPDKHLSVIVFSNNGSFNPAGMALKVADIFLRDKYIPDKSDQDPAPIPANNNLFSTDPAVFQSYCGDFQLRPGFNIHVSAENAGLFVEAHDIGTRLLTQVSKTEFTVPEMRAKITFVPDNDGIVNSMDIEFNGQKLTAHRIKEFDINSVNLIEYEGSYYSPELETTYTFTAGDGRLLVSHQRVRNFDVTPTRRDQFSTGGWFFNQVDFLRDSNNRINGCRIASGKAKGFAFTKVSVN